MRRRLKLTCGVLASFPVGLAVFLVAWFVLASATPAIAMNCGYGYWLGPPPQQTPAEGYVEGASRIPQWTPDGEAVVVGVRERIYRVNVRGGDWDRIPQDRLDGQYSPAISPEGRVAFVTYNFTKNPFRPRHQRYVETMNLDGGEIKRLGRLGGGWPSWSPDGSYLLAGLEVFHKESGVPRLELDLQSKFHWRAVVIWSPDASRLAVASQGQILTYDLATQAWNVVANGGGVSLSGPAWIPPGERLYYIKREPGLDTDNRPAMPIGLYSARYDGAYQQPIVELDKDFALWVRDLALSPTGDQLLFVGVKAGRPNGLYVINTDGTGLARIFESRHSETEMGFYRSGATQRNLYASWSPDGNSLAVYDFLPPGRTELHVVSPDGSDSRLLASWLFIGPVPGEY